MEWTGHGSRGTFLKGAQGIGPSMELKGKRG